LVFESWGKRAKVRRGGGGGRKREKESERERKRERKKERKREKEREREREKEREKERERDHMITDVGHFRYRRNLRMMALSCGESLLEDLCHCCQRYSVLLLHRYSESGKKLVNIFVSVAYW
jgi:uncharacterized membrane protein YdbT with pleckstrin-like domain